MSTPGPRSLVLAAEILLAALTLAVVLGMGRLFDGGGWLGPIAANAVAAHLVVTAARHRGLSLPVVAVLMIPAAALVVSWTSYWSTTFAGMPTGTTWTTAWGDLSEGWTLYQQVVAPTPAEAGFVVATSAAVWVVAYVADWAAFRLWVPFEATLPAGTLFLFTALLGTPRGRSWSVGFFAGTVIGFLLLHRLARQEGSVHWVAGRSVPGRRSILTAGALVGAVAVVVGVALGPSLPGAGGEGFLDLPGMGDNGTRVTLSPLVDIRARLVDQSSREMFRVQSTEPAYWRLTSLDRFTGQVWSSSSSYDDADQELPVADEVGVPAESVQQTFTIEALAAIWLPSAFVPRTFDPVTDAAALFDERSATLIVNRDLDVSDGLVYQVTSEAPRITLADIEGGGGDLPEDIVDRYLELPDDFSPRVRALAEQVTQGAVSPYEAARRLQDHLRQFTYDLTVQAGHSGDALETFLFDVQRGYCEQFAGAYAAMARAVGIPARVAVGFTQGESDPTQPGTYIVRGEHAHAWPEVWIAGIGWVAFEPTPGRGSLQGEAYTGQPESQDTPGQSTTATTRPPEAGPADPGVTQPGGGDATTTPPTVEPGGALGPTTTTEPRDSTTKAVVQYSLVGLGAAAGAVALFFAVTAGIVGVRRWRRVRRLRDADSAEELVVAQGDHVVELVAVLGIVRHRWETANEFGRRLSRELGVERAPLLGLLQTRAEFDPAGLSPEDAEVAAEVVAEVDAAVRARTHPLRRFLSEADPRSAERRARARAPRTAGPRISIQPLPTES